MLPIIVEINLLEEKEKRNAVPYFIVLLGVLLLFMTMFLLWNQKQGLIETTEKVNKTIMTVKLETAQLQKALQDETQEERRELKTKSLEVEQAILPTIPLIKHFVALLPERGFIQDYMYSNNTSINLQVEFDTLQETAAYTNSLIQASYITSVNLQNITTEQIAEGNLNILPRYVASYSIEVDTTLFKQEVEENEN